MKSLFACILLSAGTLLAAPYTDIQDLSDLPLLSPDLMNRKSAKMILPNGLQILLISDENADQSAAVVAVQSGSWCDPEQYPGMAHFCEHMLFMGTEKYPDTNDFSSLISNYDGHTNAFTAPDKTVYMFSSHEKGFLSLLDRFAHFFIDPTFNPSNISREMHAVDQEFALQRENDGWREYYVFKETSNTNHPNHLFSTGNSTTLSKIPQSALKSWHQNHYGADRIRVAIYSSLPLDDLKNAAAVSFMDVPPLVGERRDLSGPLTSAEQKNHIIHIEPIQQRQTIGLSWELPPHLADDASKSADFVAYALQRGQQYSLLQKLKNEGLVDDVRVQVNRFDPRNHAFFEVDLALSNKGIQNTESVISYIFQAIKGLKTSGLPESLFNEKNALAKLNYQYQKRTDAFQFVSEIGRNIFNEDLATFPRNSLLSTHYNPQNIHETLSFLTPEQCSIVCVAPREVTKIAYDKKEKWLNVPYTIRPIPLDSLAAWNQAKPNPDIRLAGVNPFVPTNLKSIPDPELGNAPACIANSNLGIAYYARCNEYQTPEAAIYLHILSPEINASARSSVLASLYIDHLTDQLHPILSTATSAGLNSSFEIDKNRINLTLSGFSEKAPLLLQEIIKQMPLHTPTREQFELYVARHEKEYANSSKIIPVRQAKELLSTLIHQGKTTKQENLSALKVLSYEDFALFHKKLFEKTYFEALFAGNLSLKTAESSWLDILHSLGKTPYPKSEHPQTKALHLPEEEGPFLITKSTNSQGNAAILLIDEGDFTIEKKAAQKILSAALYEPFFDTLRTKQKTGYIAQSSDTEFEKRLYQYFLVQSNTHQCEDLLHRFELFLEEFREDFSTYISEERFNTLKASTIDSVKNQFRNIEDKSHLWDALAFDERGDFSLIEKRIEGLEKLSYERFSSIANETLSRANRKRLAILYAGKIPSPFAYLPTTVADLTQVATYAPRPERQAIN